MIYFPSTLTPVPGYPGYFWDVKDRKMFSIKVGGELRELRMKRLWAGVAHKFNRYPKSPYYEVSHNGRRRYLFVENLKRLELVDYDIPVVERVVEIA